MLPNGLASRSISSPQGDIVPARVSLKGTAAAAGLATSRGGFCEAHRPRSGIIPVWGSPWDESPKTTPSQYCVISGTWVELVETNRACARAAKPLPALSRRVEIIEASSKGSLDPVLGAF